jgi:hypothetical protein
LVPYWITLTFSVVTSAIPIMPSMVDECVDLFLAVDDLDDERQVLRQADDLGRVQHARMSEAHGTAQDGGPGDMHLPGFEHDRLVERLVIGLVGFADEDAQQHGVAGEWLGQIHFMLLMEAAST